MWGIIATWTMALDGVSKGASLLENGGSAGDVVEDVIKQIEDFPYYKSVGYGGLPNEEMEVELDAGYMDGDTLDVGAVASIKDFKNPISIARRLSKEKVNSMLVGAGAEKFAHKQGFERKNMLSERAKIHYENRVKEMNREIKPYDGHDTVGVVGLDIYKKMVVGTSTSGLFMKRKGRVGDSPIVGSGFYVDSLVGGATATGLGEDLMRCCVSYEVVRLMGEGVCPQEACDKVINYYHGKLKSLRGKVGDMSLVAMNHKGEWGASTNIQGFSFVVATSYSSPKVYLGSRVNGVCVNEVASKEWIEDYMKSRMAPLERK